MERSLYKTGSLCVRTRSTLAFFGAAMMGMAGVAGVPQHASAQT